MTTLTPREHRSGRTSLTAYDFGAHLARWAVDGVDVVWVSEAAVLDGTKAIRGGIPVCFPWFAAGPDGDLSPSHGLVRTTTWRPVGTRPHELWAWEITSEDVAGSPGAEHLRGPFHLRYAVSPGGDDALTVRLEVTNPGETPLRAEVALHTYLHVGDVREVEVEGLDGAQGWDKVAHQRFGQVGDLRPEGQTDLVYDRSGGAAVVDPVLGRRIGLEPSGATQTVVWNPWEEECGRVPDLEADDWLHFLCVETAATGEHALEVAAGATQQVAVTLSLRPLHGV